MNALAPTLTTRYMPTVKPAVRDLLLIVVGSLFVAVAVREQVDVGMP